jgi:threonine dehydrogenase-like Zn-dependent dehydrogenase
MNFTKTLEFPEPQISESKGTMKVATLVAPRTFDLEEVAIPNPKANEIIFKVEGCGVCASSIPVYEGREWFTYPLPPGQPGHEAWGSVIDMGSEVKNLKIGDRVAALSYQGFAEYDKASASSVVCIPETLKNFPGEPLGCAINIFKRAQIHKGQTVAIVGAGFLGSLLIQLSIHAGATVIALAKREYSLQLAEYLDADFVIPMDDYYKAIAQVKEITNGLLCERVIEVTGKEMPLNLAAELTAERGRLTIAGYHQDGLRSVNLQLWNWRGIDVINAHERDPMIYLAGMREAVDAVRSQILTTEKLYNMYPLKNIQQAFEDTIHRPKGFTKAIIKM